MMTKHLSTSAMAFLCALLYLAPLVPAQTVVDTALVMSDGVRLDALYVLPTAPAPPGGYPAIVLVHGFAGSKNNNRSLALSFAREGYAATAYSVRGQGASEGLFEFFTAPRVLDDLRENILFTKQLRGINQERVAVLGASQGGLHAWNAAAYDMGVRCVVSIIANGRAEENWLENGALNWTFAAATMTPNVRFEPAVTALLQQARESGDFRAIQSYLRDHSTNTLESGVTTPTLVLVSCHDGFFNQNAALRQVHNVPAPKRIVLYPGGHSLPPDDAQEGYVMDVLYRWLDYWLKDKTALASVASPDSTAAFFDGGTGMRRIYTDLQSEQWLQPGDPLPQGIKRLDLFFDENGMAPQPPANRSQRVITYINVLGSTPIAFRTPPMERDLTVLPPPGSAHLRVQATGPRYQMNVLLYDVDPTTGVRRPMSRGHLQADDPNIERDMTFDLTSILHTVRAGHVIEVLVNGGTALFPDQSSNFGNYVLGPVDASSNTFILGGENPSRISLLVEDDGTVAVEALPSGKDMRLFPSWPNPAGNHVMLSYELCDAMSVRLTVHDAMGREVVVAAEGFMTGGLHRAALPTTTLPNGLYFCRLTTERGVLHGKFLVTH